MAWPVRPPTPSGPADQEEDQQPGQPQGRTGDQEGDRGGQHPDRTLDTIGDRLDEAPRTAAGTNDRLLLGEFDGDGRARRLPLQVLHLGVQTLDLTTDTPQLLLHGEHLFDVGGRCHQFAQPRLLGSQVLQPGGQVDVLLGHVVGRLRLVDHGAELGDVGDERVEVCRRDAHGHPAAQRGAVASRQALSVVAVQPLVGVGGHLHVGDGGRMLARQPAHLFNGVGGAVHLQAQRLRADNQAVRIVLRGLRGGGHRGQTRLVFGRDGGATGGLSRIADAPGPPAQAAAGQQYRHQRQREKGEDLAH